MNCESCVLRVYVSGDMISPKEIERGREQGWAPHGLPMGFPLPPNGQPFEILIDLKGLMDVDDRQEREQDAGLKECVCLQTPQ